MHAESTYIHSERFCRIWDVSGCKTTGDACKEAAGTVRPSDSSQRICKMNLMQKILMAVVLAADCASLFFLINCECW